jgi:hypothetical protein
VSRFTPARRRSILAWTAAALAWGTAVTTGRLEPIRASAEGSTPTSPAVEEPAPVVATAVPNPPQKGLVILRYTPSERQAPEVQTVYVKRTVAGSSGVAASAPPAAKKQTSPAPKSSGS